MVTLLAAASLVVAVISAAFAWRANHISNQAARAAEQSAAAADLTVAEAVRSRCDAHTARLQVSDANVIHGPFTFTPWGNPEQSPVTNLHQTQELTADALLYRPGHDDLRLGYIVAFTIHNVGNGDAFITFRTAARLPQTGTNPDGLNGDFEIATSTVLEPGAGITAQCAIYRRVASWIDAPTTEPAFFHLSHNDRRDDGVHESAYLTINQNPLRAKPNVAAEAVLEPQPHNTTPVGICPPQRFYHALNEQPDAPPWRSRQPPL